MADLRPVYLRLMPRSPTPSGPSARAAHASARGATSRGRRASEDLVLVNSSNRSLGRANKTTVHAQGLLHRAFSIFLVDRAGRLLLQRRNRAKYHSGGLWANSCCGHPSPGERTLSAARRRLQEELGATTRLTFGFLTQYHTHFSNGLQENEVVHVYFGPMPESLQPNPEEVMELRLQSLGDLAASARAHPRHYAFWLRHYLTQHRRALAAGVRQVLQKS